MVGNPENASTDRDDTPIEVYGDSPDRVDVPFWLAACIKLAPPTRSSGQPIQRIDRVYAVVLMMLAARYGARPDEAILIDRNSIARWAGVSRPDQAAWITDYLEQIRFITVYRRWDKHGRKSNAFDVHVRPPTDYVGPQTAAELDAALRDPTSPPMLFSPGQPNDTTSVAKGSPQYHDERGKGSETPGQPNDTTSVAKGSPQYHDERGKGSETPGQPNDTTSVAMPRVRGIGIEGEPPSGGSPEMNANAGTPAAAAAAGDPLDERPDLAEVVARLPWPGDSIGMGEARQVVEAMAYAEQHLGWGLDRMRSEGANALAYRKGDPVRFVVQRFREGNRLGRFQLVPRSERISGELSGGDEQHEDDQTSGGGSGQEPAGPVDRCTGEVLPVWCGACNGGHSMAADLKQFRLGRDGYRCSACHPDYDPTVDAAAVEELPELERDEQGRRIPPKPKRRRRPPESAA
ncbi:hypothetical protein [Bounagaea algeriensis]